MSSDNRSRSLSFVGQLRAYQRFFRKQRTLHDCSREIRNVPVTISERRRCDQQPTPRRLSHDSADVPPHTKIIRMTKLAGGRGRAANSVYFGGNVIARSLLATFAQPSLGRGNFMFLDRGLKHQSANHNEDVSVHIPCSFAAKLAAK